MAGDTLNRVSNIAFTITCAGLLALASVRVWDDHRLRTPAPAAPIAQENPLARGTRLPKIEGASFERSTATVALVLQSQCKFCAASVPFYKQLADLRRDGRVQIVVLSKEPLDRMREYVQEHGLRVDALGALAEGQVSTPGTPTLLVVTKDGTVDASWIGQLNSAQEQDVVRRIKEVARLS